MKLRRKTATNSPAYPSFDDYLNSRGKLRHGVSAGASALLISGALVFSSGCEEKTSAQPEGAASVSAPAVEQVKTCGDMPAPAQPVKPVEVEKVDPARIAGAMPAPVPPVEIGGDIAVPAPPEGRGRKTPYRRRHTRPQTGREGN